MKAKTTIQREIKKLMALSKFIERDWESAQFYGAAEALRWVIEGGMPPFSSPAYQSEFPGKPGRKRRGKL